MASNLIIPNQPYRAFSGANIYATVGNRLIGTLQGVTCSITREVAALYSFSDANPKTFVKGKRGIAGTLVFTQYDKHAVLRDLFDTAYNQPLGMHNNLFGSRFAEQFGSLSGLAGFRAPTRNFVEDAGKLNISLPASQLNADLQNEIRSVYNFVRDQKLLYSDQIPEFDITVTMVNEQGNAAWCIIGGIVLANEGWGYTLDDLLSEVAFTYVARYVTPLSPIYDPTRQPIRNAMGQMNAA
jgi:hypothetical protein